MTPPPVTIVAHHVGGIGGMERQLEKLIVGLLEAGGEVTVVAWSCELPAHERLRWIRIPGPRRPFPLAFPWFYVAGSLVAAVRRRGLLHSTGALIANRVDLTTVHFCHLGIRRRKGATVRSKRNTRLYRLSAWMSRQLSEAGERWSYTPGRARRIVAVSAGIVEELRDCFPRAADRVTMIPNGVDLELFRPDPDRRASTRAELGLAHEDLVAMFVGSEWGRKGLVHAIRAVGRRPAWHLIVAGAGATDEYAAHAEAAGAAGRVHFLGAVGDVYRYLSASDAFVLPTLYEAAPLVGYEAAASGVPLLVTPVNGIADVLTDGVSGWFVEQDAATIASRLALLEADPELRERMGREARRAAERFGWDAVVDGYRELYAELAGSSSDKRRPGRGSTRGRAALFGR